MQWLNEIADKAVARKPEGEIIIESGISPSGSYHMGYLREILTCDAVVLELRRRGRQARHIHFVDDQDGFRKVPAGLPPEYEKYLGKPLCDIPAPDGSSQSYADYCLKPFLDSVAALGVEMDVIRSHEKYQAGFFTEAIELVLGNVSEIKAVLEEVSGRSLGEDWSPIQVNEDGYLKKRPFVSLDTTAKLIHYLDKDGQQQSTAYDSGQVKLDWRLDWPARWWLLKVDVEPFGRDHATKGGSYDTGKALMDRLFKAEAPLPIAYEFINRAGDVKKMSASVGNGIEMSEVVDVLPPEVIRYFVLRSPANKTIYFDPVGGAVKLMDDFAQLLAKPDKTEDEKTLLYLCQKPIGETVVVSQIPFSHLVESYQAALKDSDKTMGILKRTEYAEAVASNEEIIKAEFKFIDKWLNKWAPESVKFELAQNVVKTDFSPEQQQWFAELAEAISAAPKGADGEWFHKALYAVKDAYNLQPKDIFIPLYKLLIGKEAGPRAGWFLSMLPRDWLIKRLRFEG